MSPRHPTGSPIHALPLRLDVPSREHERVHLERTRLYITGPLPSKPFDYSPYPSISSRGSSRISRHASRNDDSSQRPIASGLSGMAGRATRARTSLCSSVYPGSTAIPRRASRNDSPSQCPMGSGLSGVRGRDRRGMMRSSTWPSGCAR